MTVRVMIIKNSNDYISKSNYNSNYYDNNNSGDYKRNDDIDTEK